MENKNLISNEYYSLENLFSQSNRKIIIPDFQRDYCWGDRTHGENDDTDIVSSFIDTLFEEYKANSGHELMLGKIDVYENPKDHIYLTDGQQRLTTLYLLIGMLFKKTRNESLKKCLISDFEEKQDDKEPYLQYAVRESTVFFLRDLVNEFFLEGHNLKVLDIVKQPWYFSEYDLDPSIISMLLALGIIEKKLNKKDKDLTGFSEFVIDKIKIQYYDVQNKKHGEERFVIINTTGKSLTVSENVKPILLADIKDKKFAAQWEERETWFWKNRNKDKENIADNGVNDLLTWCFQIIDKKDEVDIIKNAKHLYKEGGNEKYLKKFQEHFESLVKLIEYRDDERFLKQFKFINDNKEVDGVVDLRGLSKDKAQNVLLPLLSFMSKFKNEDACYQFLRRLRKNYFDQKWKDRNKNYVDWRYILQIIEKSDSLQDSLIFSGEFEKIGNLALPKSIWYNEEEKIKTILKRQGKADKIEEWEDHPDFMGDLTLLFKAYLVDENVSVQPKLKIDEKYDVQELERIYNNYEKTIGILKKQGDNDNKKLSNLFRLFRLFSGIISISHIRRTSGIEGVQFSTYNRDHLNNIDFINLLNQENMEDYCIQFIKNKVNSEQIFSIENYNANKFIKAWLTLKVFYANEKEELLAFWDGGELGKETGVAAYVNKDSNRLINDEDFSLANSICGFGVRSAFGIPSKVGTTGEGNWCKSNIIDTPFSDISFNEDERIKDQIAGNKETIDGIMRIIES